MSLNANSLLVNEFCGYLPNIALFVFGPDERPDTGRTIRSIFFSNFSFQFIANFAIPRGIRSSPHFNPTSNFTTSGTNEDLEESKLSSLLSHESNPLLSLSSKSKKCNLLLDLEISSPSWRFAHKILVVFAFSSTFVRSSWLRALYFPKLASLMKPTVIQLLAGCFVCCTILSTFSPVIYPIKIQM